MNKTKLRLSQKGARLCNDAKVLCKSCGHENAPCTSCIGEVMARAEYRR